MALYRNFYCKFWNDPNVQKMSKDERYLFMYLFTNEHTSLCGIYEITPETIYAETKIPTASALLLLRSLQAKGRIIYDEKTNEVCVRTWLRYNGTTSPLFIKALKTSIENVKNRDLIRYLYGIDTVYIGYQPEQILNDTDSVSVTAPVIDSDVPLKPKEEEPKKQELKDDAVFKRYAANDDAIYSALLSFLEMRNKIKKPMTEKAKEILCDRLDELKKGGQVLTDVIKQSILNVWTNVYAVRPDYTNNQNGTTKPQTLQEEIAARVKRAEEYIGGKPS